MNRPRVAAPLLLALLAAAAQARARPEPWEPLSAQRADDVPAVVKEKRAIVLNPDADAADIASAATTLLQNKDVETLRKVLAGDAVAPLRGVLAALGQADPDAAEPLLEDVVTFAARTTSADLRAAAERSFDNLLHAAPTGDPPPRLRRALAWLTDPDFPEARRVVVLRALGRSKNLAFVDPLIGALADGSVAEARAALLELTGHNLGDDAGPEVWRAWWEKNRNRSREDLMEEVAKAATQELKSEKDRSTREIVDLILKGIGDSTAKQIAGLQDSHPEVRFECAQRLSLKANDEAAKNAVPVLLRRLGYAGTDARAGDPDAAPESDPHVRAALVTALGALDRSSADTRTALLAELRSPEPAVSAAAAAALEQFRNQREIVRPLLDYLTRVKGSTSEAIGVRINVLAAIASNAPSGVLDLLTAYTAPEQPPAVRANAMRAVIACDEIDTSLDALVNTWRNDPATEVRFSLAAALGDRLARLPADAGPEACQGMVQQLGYLLRDTEPSVRKEAAASLGRSASTQALVLLEKQATTETDHDVQKGLIQAVGALRQPEGGARVIGTLLSAHKDGREGLLDEAKKALATMTGDRGPEPWLAAASALDAVGTHDLAAYCCNEVVTRFGSKPEHAEAVARAKDMRASQLLTAGQAADARTLLLELEENNAEKPPRAERQLMLAEACRLLGNWAEQAEWLKAHVKDLPAGDARRAPETLAAAQALHKAGKDADALPLLSEYLLAQPADNQALMDRAAVEEALGKPEEALADLDTLLGRLPEGDALREPAQAAHARLKERTAGPVGPPAPQSEPRSEAAAPGEPGSPHGG